MEKASCEPRGVHVAVTAALDEKLWGPVEPDADVAMARLIRLADEQERAGAPRPYGGWDWNGWIDLWRCLCGESQWGEEPHPLGYLYQNHSPWVSFTPTTVAGELAVYLGRVDRGWYEARHRSVAPDRARDLEGAYRPVPLAVSWSHLEYARDFFGWASRRGCGIWLVLDLTQDAEPGAAADPARHFGSGTS